MIYLLTGEDSGKARTKAHEIINSLLKKKPDASFFKIDGEAWVTEEMERLIGGVGLFENNHIVFLDSIFTNEEAKDFLLKNLKEIEESKNIFIILELKLLKAERERIEKRAAKTQEFLLKETKPRDEFNMFALTDALGNRDRKKLWVLYNKAMFLEKAPEEIQGLLFWQLKSMIQAKNSKTAMEAGQKPFVFSKSKRYVENFKEGELERKSGELITMYHDVRRGMVDFDVELEKWVLNV